MPNDFKQRIDTALAETKNPKRIGRVTSIEGNLLKVSGLETVSKIGDQVVVSLGDDTEIGGEIVQMHQKLVSVLPEGSADGMSINSIVALKGRTSICPDDSWLGRVIDPNGHPIDGFPLLGGRKPVDPLAPPPPAASRRALGRRLNSRLAVFNTLLPIVRGQRLGLFAGSGVGKSSLLGNLAINLEADVVVLALIGERGREVRDFVVNVLGEQAMKRTVVVAATSDQPPAMRMRCAHSAMGIAEYFRDSGKQVLFLADSITRFANAHREIAISSGENATLNGYPASTTQAIMTLCERAGPGSNNQGDITAIFSVLVAGSDMEEPISDTLRGVLDGHIILDREIAERGRFPAIDVLRSVSRSLPRAASAEENNVIAQARLLLGSYERSEAMVKAGLYSAGNDVTLDIAVQAWPDLDAFVSRQEDGQIKDSFDKLKLILRRAGSGNDLVSG